MGTRGLWGFCKNSSYFGIYNRCDSYPTCLGLEVVKLIKAFDTETLQSYYYKLLLSHSKIENETNQNTEIYPTPYEFVSQNIITENDISFIYDSLFCEYAYFINFDKKVLEIYRGFNKDPHEKGPFAKIKSETKDYYGCRLLFELPLDLIKNQDIKLIEEIFYILDFFSDLFSFKGKKVNQSYLSSSEIQKIVKYINSIVKTDENDPLLDQAQKVHFNYKEKISNLFKSSLSFYLDDTSNKNKLSFYIARIIHLNDVFKSYQSGHSIFSFNISYLIEFFLDNYERLIYPDIFTIANIIYIYKCISSRLVSSLRELRFIKLFGLPINLRSLIYGLTLLRILLKIKNLPELEELFDFIIKNKIVGCFLNKDTGEVVFVRYYPFDYLI